MLVYGALTTNCIYMFL